MSVPIHDVSIWAIIPAAGLGRRMGRPKQALPYGGSTLTGTVVGCLLEAGVDGVVVVTRASLVSALDLPDDPRVRVAFNEVADSEMIDSIRIGLATIAAALTANGSNAPMDPNVGVLVVPGDMPTLSTKIYQKCMHAFNTDPNRIVIAAYGSRRGHPILFPLALRSAVDQLTGGLNELPRQHADRVYLVETADPAVTRDVDTPEEYEELFPQNSDHDLFGSLPGVGEKLAPRLLAELGDDRDRFDSPQALQCYAGTAPVSFESGKIKRVRFRRACQKALRHSVHLWANLSRATCPWVQAFYRKKRDEGQTHACALRCLGQRWLKILWNQQAGLPVWQTHRSYDPELHQRNQVKHGSWVIALTTVTPEQCTTAETG